MAEIETNALEFTTALEAATEWGEFSALRQSIPRDSKEKAKIVEPLAGRIRDMEDTRERHLLMDYLATVAVTTPKLAHTTVGTYFELAGAPDYPLGVQVRDEKLAKGLVVKALIKQWDNDVLSICLAAFRRAKTRVNLHAFWDARLALLKWVVETNAPISADDRAVFSPFGDETTAKMMALAQLPLIPPAKAKAVFKSVDHSVEKEKAIDYFDAYLIAWLGSLPQNLRLTGDAAQPLARNMVEPRVYGSKFYLAWGWLETYQREVCVSACFKNRHPGSSEPGVCHADHEPPFPVDRQGTLCAYLERITVA